MQTITMLEAQVPEDKTEDLRAAFARLATNKPPQILNTYLLRANDDPTSWRLLGVWRSAEEFADYRRSVETPAGVLMFRSLGVEVRLAMFDVVMQA